ncbi:peptidoglycan recognition protein 1-like isoform X1 [Macrosteles quadrilineatus]|uniref:peptidoglycan recognition protein 1-like isoform X1 n=1 Tax=Macrosteles quadrilineatus TaxID=74068 RepID=UPI0023E1B222|nr:peptidoglycan recognition protein 1-like isoform X1 [Macrosteles quadrilineatus]
MRTLTREKIRYRNRIVSAVPGHSYYDNAEFIPDDVRTSKIPYGKIFKRDQWGALPPRKSDGKLWIPVMYVNTVCVFLEDEDGEIEKGLKGPEAVRRFQKLDMENGMSDIRSNFIIDEDGMIYEGRGWEQKPGYIKPDYPDKQLEWLEICYIGDFTKEALNHPAHFATAKLLDMGKHNKQVSRDALLIPPKGFLYERKRVHVPRYLPHNSIIMSS